MRTNKILPSSFRDPSGFLFRREGELYRQINNTYREEYDLLMHSGLYEELTQRELLIPHHEVEPSEEIPAGAYKLIKPEEVPFISYPYEWCFSQLKEAALTTLEIQQKSLEFGMSLKDASAYNIQFIEGRAVLIDTLSFEKYEEGEPWTAYKQFCQHFLAPLSLVAYTDARLNKLLRLHVDGVPLDLASSLLPLRSRINLALLVHIHFHAKTQQRYADKPLSKSQITRRLTPLALQGLLQSIEAAVRRLRYEPGETEWTDYYASEASYSTESLQHKERLVSQMLDRANPVTVWDLGANVGRFSQLAARRGALTIALDADPAVVERHYLHCKSANQHQVLPLVMDLSNPSPSLGWAHRERLSLVERGPADLATVLALVHHLAISNNVPLSRIAEFCSAICKWLIIEFVPKSDSQVQRLLAMREDIFDDYNQEDFENSFNEYFTIVDHAPLMDSKRHLYLMHNRKALR